MPEFLNRESIADFYLILAGCSTLLFVLKLFIFSLLGSHLDLHGDHGEIAAGGSDPAFDYLSLQSILAFLMGFGWIGRAGLMEWSLSIPASLALATGVGFAFLFLSAFLMYQVKKLNCAPRQDYNDALNRTGQAYTNFAANGPGQVQMEINGRLMVTKAVNAGSAAISSFDPVKTVKVENNLLYIEKLT